jgi:hypothetical protein
MSSFALWSDKLNALLAEAEHAAQSDDLSTRLAVTRKLTDFIIASSPNTPDILALDEIAQATRRDLTNATIELRISGITARTGEFIKLRKMFAGLAGDARVSTDAVSLARAQKVVSDLTSSVLSLKALQVSLSSAQHQQLTQKISDVLTQLQQLRSDVEQLA